MKRKYYIITVCIIALLYLYDQYKEQKKEQEPQNTEVASQVSNKNTVELNTSQKGLLRYEGYVVSYNEKNLIPNWVSYELTAQETNGQYTRNGLVFRQDPKAKVAQSSNDDYKNSGWSRGHMAPAGDFKWSDNAMEETFYFTNCCPQNQLLNAGQWSTLEKKVRDWAKKYGSVTVVTGPLIWENEHGTIGANKVVVPDAFFKAILAGEQSIAFVMYNRPENENMQKCAMTVDKLESITGFDFFAELDDTQESRIESTYTLKFWNL